MTITLAVYDELRSNTLFDLNDPTGTNSGLYGSVTTKLSSDFDIGSPVLQSSSVQAQDIDATYSAFSKRATATMKLKLIIAGTSYDNLTTAVGTLAQYLTQGCVMKYSAGGNTYFIDCLPSHTPSLLSGGELAIYRAAALFQTDIDVEVSRQPYLRGSRLTASVNVLNNSTPLRDSNGDGTPDSWTILSTPTLSIASTTQSLHIVAGAASRGLYQATSAGSASAGQSWTLSCEIKVASGTAGLRLDWRTAAAANISNTDGTSTAANWTRVTLTGTAPATTDHIRATIMSSGAAATFDVRNIQLEQASTATPYRVKAETVNLDPAASGFAKMLPVYNPGTAPSPMTITTAFPDASTNEEAMDFWLATTDGVAGEGYLSDYLNGPYYAQCEANGNGWTLTAGTDTTLAGAVDGGASPGSGTSVASITHTTDPHKYNTRITFTRSTLLDCLRGTHRVFVRAKGASLQSYRLQLSWSAGGSTTETNDAFILDQRLNPSGIFSLCDLGTIEIPEDTDITLASLTLQLATRMDTGLAASTLYLDYIMLVPQANSAHVAVADATTSTSAQTLGADWESSAGGGTPTPKDLGAGDPTWNNSSGAGTVVGNAMKLNGLNQAAGIGSNTTGAFTGTTGGRHLIFMLVYENNFIGTWNAEVANVTDNTVTVTTSYARSTASNNAVGKWLIVSDTNAKVYQPRVTVTAYTSGNIQVQYGTVWTVNAISQNQQVRTDPGSTSVARYGAERLDSSGNYVGALTADRVPFWVPPGLSVLWLEAYDVGIGAPELPHFNARTLTVTPTVYPRYWA